MHRMQNRLRKKDTVLCPSFVENYAIMAARKEFKSQLSVYMKDAYNKAYYDSRDKYNDVLTQFSPTNNPSYWFRREELDTFEDCVASRMDKGECPIFTSRSHA